MSRTRIRKHPGQLAVEGQLGTKPWQHCLQDQGSHVLPQPTDRGQPVEFVGLALLPEAL